MATRRFLSLEAIEASLNTECPHCHAVLGLADRQRIDGEHCTCAAWNVRRTLFRKQRI